ncbi:MAG: NAD(P)-binding domain-containing protein [Synechococcales cyanobacterium]
MKIVFVGIGQVGAALAGQVLRAGHEVYVAARDPQSDSVQQAVATYPSLQVIRPAETGSLAEVVFLATPYGANAAALAEVGALDGQILIDCTNPVGPNLSHGLKSETSGAEQVQSLVPQARVVKAFTIYGFENLLDNAYPGYGDLRPAMLLAGDDADAKTTVADLCRQLGWDPIDTGPLAMSLHLEHMTLLWIHMARVQKQGTGFVWARLQR